MKYTSIHIFATTRNKFVQGFIGAFLCLFVLCSSASRAFGQDNYEVRKINFKGNKTFKKSELLDHMVLHESNFMQRKIQKKEASLYSSEFMETDLERLKRFYQSEGFLYADVKLDSLHVNEKKQTLNIHIRITENTPIKVDSTSIIIKDLPDSINIDRLLKRGTRSLALKKGVRFNDNDIYKYVSSINEIFINRGYVYVNTDFDLKVRSETNQADIAYSTVTGDKCQFGETVITGNNRIKERVVRRQLAYKAGETYSRKKLDKTRSNLYTLQLFRVASVAPEIDRATQRNPIPLEIRIEEMPRWMTKFGLGYGTEDKFRAFADVTYRGLLGGSSRMNLYVKHSALTPYYVSLAWIQPQLFVNNLSVSINPYIRSDNEPGYQIHRFGVNVPFTYTFTDPRSMALTYYFDRVRQHVSSSDVDIPQPESDRFLYSKSGLSGTFLFNSSRPVMSPNRGWNIGAGAKLNGYFFGGDYSYTRLWLDARKYIKVGTLTVALRGMIGSVHSSDSSGFIPVEDRFYSGGNTSNRGWARSMIGPKRDDGTPMGGKSILEMNLELRHHLFWRIDLAAFLDVSNIWSESYHYRFNDLDYTVGGGLRINTPIGPVRFDIGVPIMNEKKSVQFFLSVGQAF